MDRWNPDGISTFSWLACSLQNSSFFFLVVFACKQHTLYVSKYLLKWSKISLLLYRLLVSLWVGVAWANFLQQNLTNKQTIIIVLLVYLDQEVQKSVIERRSAMWGYLGSKITESQVLWKRWLFAFANNKRKIRASLFCSWVQSCSGTAHMSIFFIEIQKFCYHGNMKKQLLLSIIMPAAVWSSTISFLSLGVCSTYRKQLS